MGDLLSILNEENTFEYSFNILEGIHKTHAIDDSISVLNNTYGNELTAKYNLKQNNSIILTFTHEMNSSRVSKLNNTITALGWFISNVRLINNGKITISKASDVNINNLIVSKQWDILQIILEARYDIRVTLPAYLYHVTTLKKWNKIKEQGLAPKTNSKLSDHFERIYLTYDPLSAERLIPKFSKITGEENWVLLEINTAKIVNDNEENYFEVYNDPNYKDRGVYTYNNVHPRAIKKIKDIHVNINEL